MPLEVYLLTMMFTVSAKDEDTGLSYKLGAANTANCTAVSTANQTVTINDHGFRTGDKFTATGNAALNGAGHICLLSKLMTILCSSNIAF